MTEDLVIIGAGPAGLAAAKSASPYVSKIILIDKLLLEDFVNKDTNKSERTCI